MLELNIWGDALDPGTTSGLYGRNPGLWVEILTSRGDDLTIGTSTGL